MSVRYAATLPGTDILVPAEMRERYINGLDHVTTTGGWDSRRERSLEAWKTTRCAKDRTK